MSSRTVVQNVSHNKCKLHPELALDRIRMKCWVEHKTLVLMACVREYLFDVKASIFQIHITVMICNIHT